MALDVLLGLQWGDEGKGKIVDVLARNYRYIARFQGGPNAGHTLEFEGKKHVLHTIPSGVFNQGSTNLIGNGVVIDPVIFKKEALRLLQQKVPLKQNLCISRKAHLILPTHRLLDAASETAKGKAKIGSTLKGIGPAYMDKTGRNGFRVGDIELSQWKKTYSLLVKKHLRLLESFKVDIQFDLEELEAEFFEAVEYLKTFKLVDSEHFLQQQLRKKETVLAEGAQGSMLDLDFGTYPYVTSSTTTAAGACTGLGAAPSQIKEVYGIFKAYATRVGSGPFPTELFDSDGEQMAHRGHEVGATTGRPRRCGWLDLVALQYAVERNGVTQLILTKSDVLSGFKTIKICTAYHYKNQEIKYLPYNIEDGSLKPIYTNFEGWKEEITEMTDFDSLPETLKAIVQFLEKELKVPITIVSVGPDRKQTIFR